MKCIRYIFMYLVVLGLLTQPSFAAFLKGKSVTVASSGTTVALSSTSEPFICLLIQSDPSNTGTIDIIVTTDASDFKIRLATPVSGQVVPSYSMMGYGRITLQELTIDASISGDNVILHYLVP